MDYKVQQMKLVYVLVSFNRIVVTSISTLQKKISKNSFNWKLVLAGLRWPNQPNRQNGTKTNLMVIKKNK